MSGSEFSAKGPGAALPPESPLAMPSRRAGEVHAMLAKEAPTPRETCARVFTYGGALALTVLATAEMAGAMSGGQAGGFEIVLVGLFSLTFGWIALAATGALSGVLFPPLRSAFACDGAHGPLMRRTALVMPVYNEDPKGPMAALQAMAEGLQALGVADAFEIFLASDTNRPAAWARETAAVATLREEIHGVMPVWYRRRSRNVARKSGNVEDFVRRFGGRYDAMVMLDADSVMAPETLVALSRAMRSDAKLGLLQTVPRLVGATGLLPRLQAFASRVYGPVVARGVAAWQGPDGNYWGHNAILRMEAFAGAAGLPELKGPGVLGGAILSHDFAEAAWLRRAGWSVRMDPDLGGSFEEGPPTLLDICVRDRRWMQGNFQHAGIVGARGLSWISRAHLLSGILGYLMSPLWLALMAVGAFVAWEAAALQPTYFSAPFQLEPTWPRFDSERMLGLFWLSMGVLLVPKALGLARDCVGRVTQGRAHEVPGLLQMAWIELVASALYAPVAMATQTRHCVEILAGRDAGWSVQTRAGEATPWSVCLRRHLGHTAVGVLAALAALRLLPDLAPWLSPTLIGLALAIPLSRVSGSAAVGGWLAERLAPSQAVPILVARDRRLARYESIAPMGLGNGARTDLRWLLERREAAAKHFGLAAPPAPAPRGEPDLAHLSARAKVLDARTLEELEGWLTQAEEIAVLGDIELFHWAAALPSRVSTSTSKADSITARREAPARRRRSIPKRGT